MGNMTSKRDYPPTVEIQASQVGGHIILDWRVYRSSAGGVMKRVKTHRRVMIRHDADLSPQQLTSLCSRMAAYILGALGGNQHVPRHLPWREVGATEWSVPPGGGEGGANPAGPETLTERGM